MMFNRQELTEHFLFEAEIEPSPRKEAPSRYTSIAETGEVTACGSCFSDSPSFSINT